jgi:hypothetical protein
MDNPFWTRPAASIPDADILTARISRALWRTFFRISGRGNLWCSRTGSLLACLPAPVKFCLLVCPLLHRFGEAGQGDCEAANQNSQAGLCMEGQRIDA